MSRHYSKGMKDISLTGFMGSGKSSVGKALAALLPDRELIDLDEAIEKTSGRTIPDIFKEDGEKVFRQIEKKALESIARSGRGRIISLGGGTVTTPACREILKESSVCFYLKASVDTLVENLKGESSSRPLLSPGGNAVSKENLRDRITGLMGKRESCYLAAADHVIVTDGRDVNDIAAEIASLAR